MPEQDGSEPGTDIDRLIERYALEIVDEAHGRDPYDGGLAWEFLGERVDAEAGPKSPFWISQQVRRQHLYVLGRTGTGKSTLLEHLALSDIARGDGLLVLDPHGDLAEDVVEHCPERYRDRLIYWDLSDREWPVPLNLFECRPGQNKDTVCSEVIGVFKRLYGESWGPALEDLLRNLTLAMLDHQLLGDEAVPAEQRFNATLKEAHDFLFNQALRRSYYPYLTNRMVLSFWQDQYDNLGYLKGKATVSREQIRYSASTTNKLRRLLLNELLFDLTTNARHENTVDFRTLMDERRVLVVNLSKGRLGEDNSSLIGSVLLSRLLVSTLSRADQSLDRRRESPFHVIADEFQSFATGSFKLLLSEARKYGVTLTLAHQHRDQLDLEMKGAVLNCGSLIAFRSVGKDAADVAREYDATPKLLDWSYEQKHLYLPYPWFQLLTPIDLPTHGRPAESLQRIAELEERIGHLKKYLNDLREASLALPEHSYTCNDREHADCAFFTRWPGITSKSNLSELERRSYEVERPELLSAELELESVWQVIAQRLPQSDAQGPFWTRKGLTENAGLFTRKPRSETYAEAERRIANQLTQLPNFEAMVRLVNGTETTIRVQPPLPPSGDRDRLTDQARKSTHKAFAIAPSARRSIEEAAYLRALNVSQAQLYEAELEEQP